MKTILFLCTGNSCRSQMAEGFARKMLPPDFAIYSAGTRADGMNRFAIRAMAEAGIDISSQYSKTLDSLKDIKPDVVITLCDNAKQAYPVYSGKVLREHWGLEDPADAKGTNEEIMDVYRKTRDEIEKRIREFLK